MSFSSSVSLGFVTLYFALFGNNLGLTRCMHTKRHFHPSFITRYSLKCKPNMSLSPAPSSSNLQHLAAHSVILELKMIGIQIMLYIPWANAVFQVC
jgi:hypothetical protein